AEHQLHGQLARRFVKRGLGPAIRTEDARAELVTEQAGGDPAPTEAHHDYPLVFQFHVDAVLGFLPGRLLLDDKSICGPEASKPASLSPSSTSRAATASTDSRREGKPPVTASCGR